MAGGTLVIGDVHGCAAELDALLRLVGAERVVLVGDLFTKGPDPGGVWSLVKQLGLDAVLGNHDLRLLDHLRGARRDDLEAAACVRALDDVDWRWRAWTAELPVFRDVGCFTVVHAGLHPSGDRALTSRRMAVTMRRWPGTGAADPYWTDVYAGDARVIYGHDARRGLFRRDRDGEPWLIGLDSGCVYGGRLSGYLLDEDRVISVPALKAWRATPTSRAGVRGASA